MPNSPYEIARTLSRLVHNAGTPEELLRAVRKAHPEAKKKEIVLAAFGVMIEQCEAHGMAAGKLHALAMDNRSPV